MCTTALHVNIVILPLPGPSSVYIPGHAPARKTPHRTQDHEHDSCTEEVQRTSFHTYIGSGHIVCYSIFHYIILYSTILYYTVLNEAHHRHDANCPAPPTCQLPQLHFQALFTMCLPTTAAGWHQVAVL